jgi:hypothetical protein
MPLADLHTCRTALQRSIATYAVALQPKDAPLPRRRHELNFRTDGATAPTLADAMAHLTGTFQANIAVKQARAAKVHIPYTGNFICDVAAQTRVSIDLTLRDGLPSGRVRFNHPVYVHNPVAGTVGNLVNWLIGFQLQSLELGADNSVWVEGRVESLHHLLGFHTRRCVKAGNRDAQPADYSLVGIWLATGLTVLRAIPAQACRLAERRLHLSLRENEQTDFVGLLDSLAPMLGEGTLRGEANIHAKHPSVLRFDVADVLLEAQDFPATLQATVSPQARTMAVTFAPQTRLNAPAVRLGMEGTLIFSQTAAKGCVRGRNLRLSVEALRLDAFFNNGTPSAMLLPLHIDTEQTPCMGQPAVAAGNFDLLPLLQDPAENAEVTHTCNVQGEVHFCLPASLADSHRRVGSTHAQLEVDAVAMQLLVEGHLRKNSSAAQTAAAPHLSAQMHVAVTDLNVTGTLRSGDAPRLLWGCEATAPFCMRTAPGKPAALDSRLSYDDAVLPSLGNPLGITFALRVPMVVGPPGQVSVTLEPGSLCLTHLSLHTQADLRLGAHVADPSLELEGEASCQLQDLQGHLRVHPQPVSDLEVSHPTTFTLCGRNFSVPPCANNLRPVSNHRGERLRVAPPQAEGHLALRKPAGSAQWLLRGRGSFDIPVQLPHQSCLDITLAGGRMALGQTHARLRSDNVRFELKDGLPQVLATVVTQASTLADLDYAATLQMSPTSTVFEPCSAAAEVSSDCADDTASSDADYASAQENFDDDFDDDTYAYNAA